MTAGVAMLSQNILSARTGFVLALSTILLLLEGSGEMPAEDVDLPTRSLAKKR